MKVHPLSPPSRFWLIAGLLLPGSAFAQALSEGETLQPTDEVVRLSPFEVSGSTDRGYIATRSAGATKTNTPTIELAHTVSVFNVEFIEDTGADSITDLVRFTGNVSSGAPEGDSRLQVRGFPVNRLRNGLPFPDSGAFTFDELAGVERVEVIKGASAVLFGTSGPGGLLNVVDKRPQGRQRTEVKLQAGDNAYYRAQVDSTGPLISSGDFKVNYRAIGAYEDSESWRIGAFRKRYYLNGSLDFIFNRNTHLVQRVDFQDDDLNENYAKPWIWFPAGSRNESQGTLLNLPDEFSRGEIPPLSYKVVQRFNWESVIEHYINDNWSVRGSAVYSDVFGKRQEVFISAQTANINVWPRFWQLIPDKQQQWVYEATTIGNFEVGPTKHTLLAGANHFSLERASANIRFNTAPTTFDVFNPNYGVGIGPEVTSARRLSRNTADSTGYFVQDQIKLFNDRLHLVLGVRRDQLDQEVLNLVNGRVSPQSDNKTSPRYGLLWRATKEISLYASYNESFTPSPGTGSAQGVPFPTPTGQQSEIGAKFELLEGRLVGGISAFELKRQNLTTVDVLNPGFSVATGEVTSTGYEMDLGFNVSKNWQIIAALGIMDTEISKDNNPAMLGKPFANAPELTAAFWTKYEFHEGRAKGLNFGLGANHESGRLAYEGGVSGIRITVPDYTIYNLLVGYNWGNRAHKVTLNVSNLFDESHVLNTSGARFFQMGDRRQFRLSYTYSFN